MAEREYREIQKRLSSADAAPYIGLARVLLGKLKEQMRFQKLSQLRWQRVPIAPGVLCTVWSVFGHDGVELTIEQAGEERKFKCDLYLSGLLQDVLFNLTHFYPARVEQGFERIWYDTWELKDGDIVPKEKFTKQEERLYKIGWSVTPIYPHHFSGSMRKVAQKLAGVGKLLTANLGTTWDRTHGLLTETYSSGDWESGFYGSKRWLVEIAPDGVYAMRVNMCNEAATAGLTKRQWVEMPKAERDKYDFLPVGFKSYQRKVQLATADTVQDVYKKQPLFQEYGWAFNYSGTEAQIIVWDWDASKTYKVFYRYRLAITPTSATLSEAEHGIYWWPKGVGGLQVPNYGCGTIETFISYYLGHEADDPYSPDPGSIDTPVAVYYDGDNEVVYRVKRTGTYSSGSDYDVVNLNGYDDFLASADDCALGPGATVEGIQDKQRFTSSFTGKVECFYSPVTLGAGSTYTGSAEVWGLGQGAAGPNPYWIPSLTQEQVISTLAASWGAGAPACHWGGVYEGYGYDNRDRYEITYKFVQDSGSVSTQTVDSLTFPWNDREAMFHYRWQGKHAGTRSVHTYVAIGVEGTNLFCRTPNPTDASAYVCAEYGYDYVGVSGGPAGSNIYYPNDIQTDLGTVVTADAWDVQIQLILGTTKPNVLWNLTHDYLVDNDNIYTTEKTCVDGFLLDALVGAFNPSGWAATKNAALYLCGTIDYGMKADLLLNPSTDDGTIDIHTGFNIFSSYFIGQETEQ